MTCFVDTSALVKRYVNEQGSLWVVSWIHPSAGNTCLVSELASIEIFSAFARREKGQTITPAMRQIICNDFLFHVQNEYSVISVDSVILVNARALVNQYPLRTLDAIQLACALQAKSALNTPLSFISADTNLLTVAAAEGFAIDNPNLH